MNETKQLIPLVIKYKPKKLDEVIGRDEIIHELRAYLDQNYIPNLMFEGVQGTGKTLIANLLIKESYNFKVPRQSVLKIDASTDNNVKFMRDIIVKATETVGFDPNVKKTIFLDEGDYITKPAQATLRRPIEKALKSCTFYLACNYKDKIILPIQDRFKLYHYDQLSKDAITQGIRLICDGEDIDIVGDEQQIYDLIYKHSRGTLRFVYNNFMEPARALGKLTMKSIKLTYDSNISFIKAMISRNISTAIQVGIQNPRGGLSGAIDYITKLSDEKLPLKNKSILIGWIADSYRDMTDGVPYPITITDLVYKFVNAMGSKKKK